MQQQTQSRIAQAQLPIKLFRCYKDHTLPINMVVVIACQGPTANITPFITHARNEKDPFERYYMEPQYDGQRF